MNKVAKLNDLVASTDQLPSHLKAVEGIGRGNEEVGLNVQIPRIKLLQKMSNEVDKHHNTYIEGSEPGQLINTLTNQNYGNSLYVISLKFKTEYVVWRDMEKGGGYGGAFASEQQAKAALDDLEHPNEDYSISETHAHMLLIKDPETGELERAPVIMDFKDSKLRVSKAWNSQLGLKGGDRFAGLWQIIGVPTENKRGQQFMNLEVKFVGWAQEADYKVAEEMYEGLGN